MAHHGPTGMSAFTPLLGQSDISERVTPFRFMSTRALGRHTCGAGIRLNICPGGQAPKEPITTNDKIRMVIWTGVKRDCILIDTSICVCRAARCKGWTKTSAC
jgi:hypothetical protein